MARYMDQDRYMSHEREPRSVSGWTGWVAFTSIVMAISGFMHVLYGLGGIFSQDWYVNTAGTVYLASLSSWGWAMLLTGFLLILSASLLMAGNMLGRIVGLLLAVLSLAFNMALFSVAPVWSTLAIIVSIVVIYAIAAHGREMKQNES